MVSKKTGGKSEGPIEEESDYIDAIDAINGEMAFLKEVVQLLQAASLNKEEGRIPPLFSITDDMLCRMERIKKHCGDLFSHCGEVKDRRFSVLQTKQRGLSFGDPGKRKEE